MPSDGNGNVALSPFCYGSSPSPQRGKGWADDRHDTQCGQCRADRPGREDRQIAAAEKEQRTAMCRSGRALRTTRVRSPRGANCVTFSRHYAGRYFDNHLYASAKLAHKRTTCKQVNSWCNVLKSTGCQPMCLVRAGGHALAHMVLPRLARCSRCGSHEIYGRLRRLDPEPSSILVLADALCSEDAKPLKTEGTA
jgi:hypothetical protein